MTQSYGVGLARNKYKEPTGHLAGAAVSRRRRIGATYISVAFLSAGRRASGSGRACDAGRDRRRPHHPRELRAGERLVFGQLHDADLRIERRGLG